MTEARMSRADRKTQRVRAVTDPDAVADASPEAVPVAKVQTFDLLKWALRNRATVFAFITALVGVIYGVSEIVVSANKSEAEQAEIARDVKSIDARLHNIEGQLKVLIERKEPQQ